MNYATGALIYLTGNKDRLGLVGLPDRDAHDVQLLLPSSYISLAEHVNSKSSHTDLLFLRRFFRVIQFLTLLSCPR